MIEQERQTKGEILYGEREIDSIYYQSEEMKKPEYSVYLEDYVDIGVFGEDEDDELYLKKHKITTLTQSSLLHKRKRKKPPLYY